MARDQRAQMARDHRPQTARDSAVFIAGNPIINKSRLDILHSQICRRSPIHTQQISYCTPYFM